MPPQKQPDDEAETRRQSELAQKSEAMSRELSQKREMRIRQDRVRHLGDDPADDRSARDNSSDPRPRSARSQKPSGGGGGGGRSVSADDRTLPSDATKKLPVREPSWERRPPSMLDDVASELEELMRDLRQGWRVWHAADKITFASSLLTLLGTLLPWVTDRAHPFQIGLVAGGVIHAALACAAIALLVGRAGAAVDARGLRVSHRELVRRARRASLWHLLIGALSTFLCAYLLVVYGFQRSAQTQLEIRFGLYVTLAAGMGLSYGGFSRFWSRHE